MIPAGCTARVRTLIIGPAIVSPRKLGSRALKQSFAWQPLCLDRTQWRKKIIDNYSSCHRLYSTPFRKESDGAKSSTAKSVLSENEGSKTRLACVGFVSFFAGMLHGGMNEPTPMSG